MNQMHDGSYSSGEKIMKKLLSILVSMALMAPAISPMAHAAVPQVVSFQGRLTDARNTPRNGLFSIVFEIYEQPAGGAPLWAETQNSVMVDNGIFSAQLGSVTPIPLSALSADTRYLSVTVAGETLSPRQRLLSTPYALNAGRMFTTLHNIF